MLQSELMPILLEMVSYTVALRAIREAEEKDYIESERSPGKGNPKLLKIKTKETFSESLFV